MANGSKLYAMSFATVAAATTAIAANPDAYAAGTLIFDEATGKLYVVFAGAPVLVGGQS